MTSGITFKEAKERAGRFCALRERSPNEVLEKVKSWGLTQEDSEKLVQTLVELNFIDEQRFANAYCHDKFEFNSWGKNKIKAAIYLHKISMSTVEAALDRIDLTRYRERIDQLARKKWEKIHEENVFVRKQKTSAYLASKGFELDLIREIVQSLGQSKGRV